MTFTTPVPNVFAAHNSHQPVGHNAGTSHHVGFLYRTAPVVHYTGNNTTGLSAVYVSKLNIGGSTSPGYLLTGGPNGQVGWNVPSLNGGNAQVPQFYGAKIYIASQTNFTATVPFKITVQSADGVNHVCSGSAGQYNFIPASGSTPAYSTYQAYANQFTPSMGLGNKTINKLAFEYTGTGTVAFAAPLAVGSFNLTPSHYSYATKPDANFNYE